MVATDPAFVTEIKNAVHSDQEINKLITDMVTSNPAFSTHQKGPIDAPITEYAYRHSIMFGIHANTPL